MRGDAKDAFPVQYRPDSPCRGALRAPPPPRCRPTTDFVCTLTGFLTASNWLQPETYDIAPSDRYNQQGLLRYMDLQCGKNPTKKIIDVARGFVKAVYDKRVKAGS